MVRRCLHLKRHVSVLPKRFRKRKSGHLSIELLAMVEGGGDCLHTLCIQSAILLTDLA